MRSKVKRTTKATTDKMNTAGEGEGLAQGMRLRRANTTSSEMYETKTRASSLKKEDITQRKDDGGSFENEKRGREWAFLSSRSSPIRAGNAA